MSTDDAEIVCALDASPNSSGAVSYAAWLSRRLEAHLQVVSAESGDELMLAAGDRRTRLLVLAVCPDGYLTLEQVCAIVQLAPQPVLVVTSDAAERWRHPARAARSFRRAVVCGVHDKSAPPPSALRETRRFARWLRARLVLVHAHSHPGRLPMSPAPEWEVGSTSLQTRTSGRPSVEDELNARHGEIQHVDVHGDPADVLDDVAAIERAATIAVAPRSLAPDRIALEGSVTFDLLRRAGRPVLAIGPTVVADGTQRLGHRGGPSAA